MDGLSLVGWLADAARALDDAVRAIAGVPAWLPPVAAFIGAAVATLVRRLDRGRRERVRRRRLAAALTAGVERAGTANALHLQALDGLRAEAHAVSHVRGLPVDALQHVRGVGTAGVERLRRAGFLRLGEVVDGDVLAVPGVGRARFEAIMRHVNAELTEARQRVAGRPLHVPRVPAVDQRFDDYRAALAGRQRAFHAHRPALAALLDAPSPPARALGPGTVAAAARAALGLLLVCALPFAALGYDPASGPVAALLSVSALWTALVIGPVLHALLGARPAGGRSQAPDPGVFAEQRVGLLLLAPAAEWGVAPPEVRFVRGAALAAHPRGWSSGPSLIEIDARLPAALDAGALYAQALTALARLRLGGAALDATLARLGTPLAAATALAARLTGALGIRVRHRPRRYADGDFLEPRRGAGRLVYAALWLPAAVVFGGLATVRLAAAATLAPPRQAIVRRAATEAIPRGVPGDWDRSLRQLDAAYAALRRRDRPGLRFEPLPGGAERVLAPRAADRPALRLAGIVAWLEDPRRPLPVALGLSVGVPLLALALLTAAAFGARVTLERGAPIYAVARAQIAEWTGPEAPVERTLRIAPPGGCHLRARPSRAAPSLRVLPHDARCTTRGEPRDGWHVVRCEHAVGYISEGCAED